MDGIDVGSVLSNVNMTTRQTLAELEQRDDFVARHIGPNAAEQTEMLAALGLKTRAELIDAVVPAAIRSREPLPLAGPKPEAEALAELKAIASRNHVFRSFIG